MREGEDKARRFAKTLRKTMTRAEAFVWSRLRRPSDISFKFRRQHPIGPYIADFAHLGSCVVVEVDGATHSSDEEIAYDKVRTAYLQRSGWRVIRVTNDDVYKHLEEMLDFIWRSVSTG